MIIETILVYILLASLTLLALFLLLGLLSNPHRDVPDWYWKGIDKELMSSNSEIPKEVLLKVKKHRK